MINKTYTCTLLVKLDIDLGCIVNVHDSGSLVYLEDLADVSVVCLVLISSFLQNPGLRIFYTFV